MTRVDAVARLRSLLRPALPSPIDEASLSGWRVLAANGALLAVIIGDDTGALTQTDEHALSLAVVFWVLAVLWWVACRWGGLGGLMRLGNWAWPVIDYLLLALAAWSFGASHPAVIALGMARASTTGVGLGLVWMLAGWMAVFGASLAGSADSGSTHAWPLLAILMSWAMVWKVRELVAARVDSERGREEQRRLLGVLSHELRSPLHVIRSAVALIDRDSVGEKDRQLLSSIEESGQSLTEMIEEALEMSAIGQGMRLALTEFRVHHLVARLEEKLGPLAARGSVQLIWSVDEQVPVVRGSKRHIEQVVQNLGSNAIKYTRAGGTVRISIHHYRQRVDEQDRVTLVFSVADTGIGISEDMKPSLFEPFTQGSVGAARRYDGIGQGLYLVKMLSDKMDGQIDVSDNPGGGTVFTWQVSLELVGENAETLDNSGLEALEAHRSTTRALRCLIVDDQANSRMVMRTFLARGGHRVREAATGQEGLEAIREGGIDIVFLDQHMPDVSGWDVLEGIKASPGWAKAPMVVMVSGAWDDQTSQEALELGASEYLPKPVDFNEVLRLLRRRAAQLESFQRTRT